MSKRRPFKMVLTGGPGAGKTATLEIIRRHFCDHVLVLPEAAGIVFKGGFPRGAAIDELKAAQRAIYHVQVELERVAAANKNAKLVICDRGTIDGLAYWPTRSPSLWSDVGTTMERELSRYDAVIHLRTPDVRNGYHRDAIRIESESLARKIDERLLRAWESHPVRRCIASSTDFVEKTARVLDLVRDLLPADCLRHNGRTRRVERTTHPPRRME